MARQRSQQHRRLNISLLGR